MSQELLIILFLGVITLIGFALIRSNSTLNTLSLENLELRKDNAKLKDELSKTKRDKDDIVSIDPGDKAILPKYGLEWTKEKESFYVTYEVEILEVSLDQVKVNAIDFSTDNKRAQEPSAKSGILSHMSNKWVSKKDINLIVDSSMRRDAKLQEILR